MSDADDARALYQQARAAVADGRYGDAIARFDELATRFPVFEALRANALYGKAYCLEKIERDQDAIPVYEEILEQYGDSEDDVLRRQTARALHHYGLGLSRLGRTDEAVAAWDEVVARYSGDEDPEFARRVAGALERKGAAMRRLERLSDALEAY